MLSDNSNAIERYDVIAETARAVARKYRQEQRRAKSDARYGYCRLIADNAEDVNARYGGHRRFNYAPTVAHRAHTAHTSTLVDDTGASPVMMLVAQWADYFDLFDGDDKRCGGNAAHVWRSDSARRRRVQREPRAVSLSVVDVDRVIPFQPARSFAGMAANALAAASIDGASPLTLAILRDCADTGDIVYVDPMAVRQRIADNVDGTPDRKTYAFRIRVSEELAATNAELADLLDFGARGLNPTLAAEDSEPTTVRPMADAFKATGVASMQPSKAERVTITLDDVRAIQREVGTLATVDELVTEDMVRTAMSQATISRVPETATAPVDIEPGETRYLDDGTPYAVGLRPGQRDARGAPCKGCETAERLYGLGALCATHDPTLD